MKVCRTYLAKVAEHSSVRKKGSGVGTIKCALGERQHSVRYGDWPLRVGDGTAGFPDFPDPAARMFGSEPY
jgi:hypothetical protein